jgi:hypothetical protein
MDAKELQANMERIQGMLQPWQAAISSPAIAQEKVLQNFLKIYGRLNMEYSTRQRAFLRLKISAPSFQ